MKSINKSTFNLAIFIIFLGGGSGLAMHSSNTFTSEELKTYFAERLFPDIKVKEIVERDLANSFVYFDGPNASAMAKDFSSMLFNLYSIRNSPKNEPRVVKQHCSDIDGRGIILAPNHKRQLYMMTTADADLSRVENFYRKKYENAQLELTQREKGIYVFSSPDKSEMNNLISSLRQFNYVDKDAEIGKNINLFELTIDLNRLTKIYSYVLACEGKNF